MPEADSPGMCVRIGDVRVAVSDGTLTSSIDDLDRAEFIFGSDQVADQTIDFFAPVEMEIDGEVVHSGSVVTAVPVSGSVAVRCQSGVGMTENLLGALVSQDVPVQDLAYAAAREAGFDDDHIVIHELDTLPTEPIEVAVALRDVVLTEPYRVGPVWVVPAGSAAKAIHEFDPRPDLLDEMVDADAYAIGLATRATMFAGEQAALGDIDAVLGWLTVRAHYGLVCTPAGRAHSFDRLKARTHPRRESLLIARGLTTGRRWVRRPGSRLQRPTVELVDSQMHVPPLSGHLNQSERLLLLAARRALVGDSGIERTHALWEAFEIYCGGTPVPGLFSKADLDHVRNAFPTGLSAAQRERLNAVVGMVNEPSLMKRLRVALQGDGVPLTSKEEKVLRRLRDIRNDVAHGREADPPSSDDLDWGCSLLSRALVFRMDRHVSANRRTIRV